MYHFLHSPMLLILFSCDLCQGGSNLYSEKALLKLGCRIRNRRAPQIRHIISMMAPPRAGSETAMYLRHLQMTTIAFLHMQITSLQSQLLQRRWCTEFLTSAPSLSCTKLTFLTCMKHNEHKLDADKQTCPDLNHPYLGI